MSESPRLTPRERRLRLVLWMAVAVAIPVVAYLRIASPSDEPYAWAPVDQQAFTDSTRARPADLAGAAPGQTVWMVVRVRNVGAATWEATGPAPVRLATARPRDRASAVSTPAWLAATRPTGVLEASVAHDGIGTFEFPIAVPESGGPFDEYFDLVAEGRAWFRSDSEVHVIVRLAPPST